MAVLLRLAIRVALTRIASHAKKIALLALRGIISAQLIRHVIELSNNLLMIKRPNNRGALLLKMFKFVLCFAKLSLAKTSSRLLRLGCAIVPRQNLVHAV